MKTYNRIYIAHDSFRIDAHVIVQASLTSSKRLPPCNHIVNHSPDGFAWGYGGSGPAQLSFAICFDALNGNKDRALAVYQDVKWRFIAPLAQDEGFTLLQSDIVEFIEKIEKNREVA